MPLVDNGKSVGLTAIIGAGVYASLHTATPDGSGSSEVAGGSPAYARKAVTWGSVSAGSVPMAATFPVFDVPASTTIAAVGLWSAATSGTFYGYWPVTSQVYASQGTYTLSAAFTLSM